MCADIRFITPEQYRDDVGGIMERIAEKLRSQGREPYILPEGASNAIGAMGYLAATEEIAAQLAQIKLNIDAVVCATGSGGTQAGLIMGKKLYNMDYGVYGINVCDDEDYFKRKIFNIIETAQQRFNFDLTISHNEIHILDGYVGEGYALNKPQEIEFIKSVAKDEGIVLDPVYTGKAMLGLMDQIQKGRFSPKSNILFLHSGGLFGLFPKKNMFY
jgi:D-cysteine desulfhydrase